MVNATSCYIQSSRGEKCIYSSPTAPPPHEFHQQLYIALKRYSENDLLTVLGILAYLRTSRHFMHSFPVTTNATCSLENQVCLAARFKSTNVVRTCA